MTANDIISTLPLEEWFWDKYDYDTLYQKVSKIIEDCEKMAEYIEEDDDEWSVEQEIYDSVRGLFED